MDKFLSIFICYYEVICDILLLGEIMSGFSILMFIFATCILLVGLYMFTGYNLAIMDLHPAFKNLSRDNWINIGKWTMISSVIIYILAIIGWVFNF